jgi:hypothetical protein
MVDTLKTLAALALLFVVLPRLILLLIDSFRNPRKRRTAAEVEAARNAWIDRLRRPDFQEVERICGGAIPKRLKLAYKTSDLIFRRDVDFTPPDKDPEKHCYWIQEFVPMDAEGQSHTTDLSDFGEGCCFAGDGMGNFYWTPVSETPQEDAPVFFACHDPYGNEKVADSLEEFFSWFEAKVQAAKP